MVEELEIRLATPRDAEAIAIESMAEIEHNLSWDWSPLRVQRAISDPATNVVVAYDKRGMAGFGVMRYDEEVAHLQLFAVREDIRRRGVGARLLRWLEDVAHTAGVTRFKVEARRDNVVAVAFYRKHGYSELESVRGMYQGFEDGVRLEKVASEA